MIDSVAMPHMFPMIRAGGLFILTMGIGVILGALWPRRRMAMLIAGGAGATLAIILTADLLTRPLGVPSRIQFWALAAAIVLEAVLIRVVVARYKRAGERPSLSADGDHFRSLVCSARTLRHGERSYCPQDFARNFFESRLAHRWRAEAIVRQLHVCRSQQHAGRVSGLIIERLGPSIQRPNPSHVTLVEPLTEPTDAEMLACPS
jgi:hypothetical protein